MKRRLKEAFRLHQHAIPGHYDIWFVMRKPFGQSQASDVVSLFATTLEAYLTLGSHKGR